MKTSLYLTIIFSCPILLNAKAGLETLEVHRSLEAVRISGGNIRVDGQLDESIWEEIGFTTGLIQRDPLEGEPATERTEFAVAYDDEYLYVGILAYTSEPDKIRSILSRRDEYTPSDWLYVSLDSYNDNRTAFEFGLNPIGVKRDLRRFDDVNTDENWDSNWEGKAARFNKGWSAEFKIPFRELRFASTDHQSWGLQINRYVADKNEDSYWTYWSKNETGWVRHYGDLIGLDNIPTQRRIYLTPYVTGQINRADMYINPVHPDDYDVLSNLGADIKIGVTNNLTLDLTINPDFGQVEADPAELNLSAFESYFEEQRPFFVEGGNIYNFSMGLGDGDQSSNSLFYTRRIGRRPHYSFWDTDSSWVVNPSSTRILSAGKLSGKTSSGWSIGLLNAVTAEEKATFKSLNKPQERKTVEPLTNYFVSRLQKDFREGNTTIGGIITATNRQINADYLDFLHREAYSGGIDVSHLFNDDTYMVNAAISATKVTGSQEALLNTQTNSIHYFQRPDASHLNIDSTATNLTGYAFKYAFSKVRGEHWRGAFGGWTFSPGFEANDLGYHRSVDSQVQFIWVQYREKDPGKVVRRYSVNFNIWQSKTFGNERTGLGGNINGNLTFMNYWRIGSGFNYSLPEYHLTALWGGPAVLNDENQNMWFWVGSDSRKEVSGSMNAWYGRNGTGTYWSGIRPNLTWRPTDNVALRGYLGINTNFDSWANWSGYRATLDMETGEAQFIMAELDQKTVSATLRLDLTLTPNLSLQYYGSPFVTAGSYRNYKRLLDPRAESFDERFSVFPENEVRYNENNGIWEIDSDGNGITNFVLPNMDFNYKQFNSNLVLRWEYVTGSSLYLVWSQGITDFMNDGTFAFSQDIRNLFKADPENIFLLKFSYLINI